MSCDVTVTLGGLTFDCETVDGDGITWNWSELDGWWDGSDVDPSISEVIVGSLITSAHEKGRALTLKGSAHGLAAGSLGSSDYFTAQRDLLQAMRLVHIPGTLVVAEPNLTLRASVRRVGRVRVRRLGEHGVLEFEVPLLAEDPRRYSNTLTTNTTLQLTTTNVTITQAITNNGDQPSHPVITIDDPATNPRVTNAADAARFVEYVGSVGGGESLVIDMANATVTKNGVSVMDSLNASSQFWSLLPGSNSVTYARTAGSGTTTASVAYRDAYS